MSQSKPSQNTYQTHRPTSTLLIPSKRPLTKPAKQPLNPSAHLEPAPSLTDKNTDTVTEKSRGCRRAVEVDLSAAPQPLLDPGLWGRMKDAAGEGVGDQRRGNGWMAIRGRMGGLGRGRRR